MIPRLSIRALSIRQSGKMFVTTLAASLIPSIAAQTTPEQNCGGLHAAIRGDMVRRYPPYTQPPFVMLAFILLNDSEKPINAVEGGWQIVIDGRELKDSDFISEFPNHNWSGAISES